MKIKLKKGLAFNKEAISFDLQLIDPFEPFIYFADKW